MYVKQLVSFGLTATLQVQYTHKKEKNSYGPFAPFAKKIKLKQV